MRRRGFGVGLMGHLEISLSGQQDGRTRGKSSTAQGIIVLTIGGVWTAKKNTALFLSLELSPLKQYTNICERPDFF